MVGLMDYNDQLRIRTPLVTEDPETGGDRGGNCARSCGEALGLVTFTSLFLPFSGFWDFCPFLEHYP
jgi:hypothetical protein